MTASVLISARVRAAPDRAFRAFTEDIGAWWVPDPRFAITPRGDGALAFEGGPGGRLVTRLPNGHSFTIGVVTAWEPPRKLAFTWRHATFAAEMETAVEVTFEAVGEETRVTVVHSGWTRIPQHHVARHGFPDLMTQTQAGEWWGRSLEALKARLED